MFGSITSQVGVMVAVVLVTAGPLRAEDKLAKPDAKAAQAAKAAAQAKAIDALIQSIEKLRATGLSTAELVGKLKDESAKSKAAVAAAKKTAAEQTKALAEKKKAFGKLSKDATALRDQLKKLEANLANVKKESDGLEKGVKAAKAKAAAAQKRIDSLNVTIQLLGKLGNLSAAPKKEPPPKIEIPVKKVSAKPAVTPEQAALAKQALAVLEANCLKCHGNGIVKSGLDMRTRETALAGGDRGPALVPGKPDMSQLLKSAKHAADPHMPPKKKIKPDEIAVLTQWVASGAHWPAPEPTKVAVATKDATVQPAKAVSAKGAELAQLAIGVLEKSCFRCHGEKKQKAELDLRWRATALKGGENGPALVPGKPEESLMYKAITKQVEPHMPPKKDLPAESLAILKQWIAEGATWPGDGKTEAKTEAKSASGPVHEYWWQIPVVRPTAPSVKNEAWVDNPIDAFILSPVTRPSWIRTTFTICTRQSCTCWAWTTRG